MSKTQSDNKITVKSVRSSEHGGSTEYHYLSDGTWSGMSKFHLQWLADQINSGEIVLPDEPKDEYDAGTKDPQITLAEWFEIVLKRDIRNTLRKAYEDEIGKQAT